jgi:bacterioferritin-associated ferredoxin
MIVCSCSVLSKANITATAQMLAKAEPGRPVTPGRIFRALGARPQCGTCFSLIRQIVADAGIAFTCPEPLAREAGDTAETAPGEGEIAFDLKDRVA